MNENSKQGMNKLPVDNLYKTRRREKCIWIPWGSRARLEHCEVGAGEGAEVDGIEVREEVEGDDGEDGDDDGHDEEGVGHCYTILCCHIVWYYVNYTISTDVGEDGHDEDGVGHC